MHWFSPLEMAHFLRKLNLITQRDAHDDNNERQQIYVVHPMDYGKKMYRGSLLESSYKICYCFVKNVMIYIRVYYTKTGAVVQVNERKAFKYAIVLSTLISFLLTSWIFSSKDSSQAYNFKTCEQKYEVSINLYTRIHNYIELKKNCYWNILNKTYNGEYSYICTYIYLYSI